MSKFFRSKIMILVFLLFLTALPTDGFSASKSTIKWSSKKVNETLRQGDKSTVQVRLTSNTSLTGVRLQLSSSLRKFVKVAKNLKSVKKGSKKINLKFSVAKNAKQGSYKGQLILVGGGKKYSKALSIALKILKIAQFKSKADTQVVSSSIGSTGGTITATSGPINGVKVEFPAGALSSTVTASLGYNAGSMTPNMGTYAGFAMTLDTGTVEEFDQPVTITAPLTDTDSVPVPYFIDPQGKLHPAQLTAIDTSAKTFSFQTFHASWYTWIKTKISNLIGNEYDTGYVPGNDGFAVRNRGSEYNRKGECFGMTSFSMWYGANAKSSRGKLYPKYLTPRLGTDSAGRSIVGQNVIATRAHNSISQHWETYYKNIVTGQQALTQEARYLAIVNAIKNTGSPVLIYLAQTTGNAAHSVLAYKYSKSSGKVSIYDPNFPNKVKAVTYNKTSKVFRSYSGYDIITYNGDGSLQLTEDYRNILKDADASFHGKNIAQIKVSSHTNGQEVTDRTVRVIGKITSGQVLVGKLTILVGATPFSANVGTDGSFNIPVSLEAGVNHLTFKTEGNNSSGRLIEVSNDMDTTDFTIKLNSTAAVMLATLTWDKNDTDVDLYVTDPTGATSWYSSKTTPDGGVLDYDITSGFGPEHWTLAGNNTIRYGSPYRVRLHYYSDHNSSTSIPTNYNVSVKLYEGTSREVVYRYRGNLATDNSSNKAPGSTGADWVDVGNFTLTQ